MSKGKGSLRRWTKQPAPPGERKQALWIRPHGAPLQVGAGSRHAEPLVAQHIPTSKTIIHIVFNLAGVAIILASIWLLLLNLPKSAGSVENNLLSPRSPELATCAGIERCVAKSPTTINNVPGGTATKGATPSSTLTPVVTQGAGTTPTPAKTSTPAPTPTLGVTGTPPPTSTVPALQVVPQSLTISGSSVCRIDIQTPLTLINAGGSPLLWSQDTSKTSPGFTITDPGGTYLIQPGQIASASVRCRRNLPVGQYVLAIDFNGGMVEVPVIVTK